MYNMHLYKNHGDFSKSVDWVFNFIRFFLYHVSHFAKNYTLNSDAFIYFLFIQLQLIYPDV